MAKQVVLRWQSVESAVKELGTETVLSWLSQFAANREFRKTYNATKQEVNKMAREDPRYKQLLAEAKAKAEAEMKEKAAKAAEPRLIKKA